MVFVSMMAYIAGFYKKHFPNLYFHFQKAPRKTMLQLLIGGAVFLGLVALLFGITALPGALFAQVALGQVPFASVAIWKLAVEAIYVWFSFAIIHGAMFDVISSIFNTFQAASKARKFKEAQTPEEEEKIASDILDDVMCSPEAAARSAQDLLAINLPKFIFRIKNDHEASAKFLTNFANSVFMEDIIQKIANTETDDFVKQSWAQLQNIRLMLLCRNFNDLNKTKRFEELVNKLFEERYRNVIVEACLPQVRVFIRLLATELNAKSQYNELFSQNETPYTVLGVSPNATSAEIRKAFLKKSKETHTDKNNSDSSNFIKVKKAYDMLSEPAMRESVDKEIKHAPSMTPGFNAYQQQKPQAGATPNTAPSTDAGPTPSTPRAAA